MSCINQRQDKRMGDNIIKSFKTTLCLWMDLPPIADFQHYLL